MLWFDDATIYTYLFKLPPVSDIGANSFQLTVTLLVDLLLFGLISAGSYYLVNNQLIDYRIPQRYSVWIAWVIIASVVITICLNLLNTTFIITAAIAVFLPLPMLIAICSPIIASQGRRWFLLGLTLQIAWGLLLIELWFGSTMWNSDH